jgi:hypothetical protein
MGMAKPLPGTRAQTALAHVNRVNLMPLQTVLADVTRVNRAANPSSLRRVEAA